MGGRPAGMDCPAGTEVLSGTLLSTAWESGIRHTKDRRRHGMLYRSKGSAFRWVWVGRGSASGSQTSQLNMRILGPATK